MSDDVDGAHHSGIHLNLDEAWKDLTGLETLDATRWGPQLRFSAPGKLVEQFYRECAPRLSRFTLYGSGDFHHLSALWVRRLQDPFILVSFDNHPDWDIRPPRWACGGWVNRALELPLLQKVAVWGCGNFECWWPAQTFGNRAAERSGKLELHVWGDQRPVAKRNRRGVILRATWRDTFERFVRQLAGANIYVTIDLDCLTSAEAVTNWENGMFEVDDLVWALRSLRAAARVIGGDICGAYSEPKYARAQQRFVSQWDHPKIAQPLLAQAREINQRTLARLWPVLTDRDQNDAGGD
ncbi:MAG: hypothetical protein M3032_03315 [Verrucomicrobiota bacterium]|nr:hypothetical protein [Verrucomicrobiota bacterium]